jgi:transposase
MQGKEVSEQETRLQSSVGIDVSKARLDVCVLPSGERLSVANGREGIRQLKRWLGRFELELVAIEATGKWHRPLWRSLSASAIKVATVDPFRVRRFAQASGIFAKTDRLDAALLARFAAVMAPGSRPPPAKVLDELAELAGGRQAAIAEQTSLKNQLSAATVVLFRRQLWHRIARLDKDIAALEHAIHARIAADPALARRFAILTSIPGIGATVAATLIALLAELGSLTDKAVAALAGLAPVARQSGERDDKRVIFGGRAAVRRMLYLAALSAARFNPDLAVFYRRLRAKGKAPKLALVAVARKLAILANLLVVEDRTWLAEPPTACGLMDVRAAD